MRLFILLFAFGLASNTVLGQSPCVQLLGEKLGPHAIEPGEGVGVIGIGLTKSAHTGLPIYWVKKYTSWKERPAGADVPGDPRWGYQIFGQTGSVLGFERRVVGNDYAYSIPSIAHANRIIDRHNRSLNADRKVNREFPLRIKDVDHLSSDREFVEDFINGLLPVSTNSAQTFLHDINYHLLTSFIVKPQFLREWQQRSRDVLRLYEHAKQKFSNDPIVSAYIDFLIKELASRIDQTGNVMAYFADLDNQKPDRFNSAGAMLIHAARSGDRLEFFEGFIERSSFRSMEDVPHFVTKGLITFEQGEDIKARYPRTPRQYSTQIYVREKLKEALSEIAPKLQGNDPTIKAMIESIRDNPPDFNLHRSWIR